MRCRWRAANDLILGDVRHAESYYVNDGRPTSETASIKLALWPLRQLYGHCPARDFDPLALKTTR